MLFDRSWYNRAGVERVMGFCSDDEYAAFMRQAPDFERLIVDAGTHLTKFWFSVTRREQRTRFAIRQIDPVRRWKLSPMDLESLDRWEQYSAAKEAMFAGTDTDHAPWISDPQQRQEARPAQRDALLPQPVLLRGQGRGRHRRGRPADRPARHATPSATDSAPGACGVPAVGAVCREVRMTTSPVAIDDSRKGGLY